MIVFKYGALKPISGFELMLSQLRHANNYRNSAIELALTRRAAIHVGCDKEEVKKHYNSEKRALYARFSTAGLLGHRTMYFIDNAVSASVSKRWKCWTKSGRFKSPYHRFDGTGYLAANSQHNVSSFAKLERIDSRHGTCTLRVCGNNTVIVPVRLDRDLPENSDLADARLHVNKVGDRWVYSLTFTIRNEKQKSHVCGTGHAAINFGWRVTKEGVRIATVTDTSGDCDYLVLPQKMISARKHTESLAGLADSVAAEFLGNSRFRHGSRRKFLVGAKLSELSKVRFVPENANKDNPTDCEHWARRDRHLYQWECDARTKMLNQRKEIYRLFARKLRAKYKTVTIENYSLAELARLATSEETPRATAARHVRFLVAPSYLREEIKNVFGDDCCDMFVTKRTKRCFVCRKTCKFDAAEELFHECEWCGASWDQDVNNANNQLLDTAAE